MRWSLLLLLGCAATPAAPGATLAFYGSIVTEQGAREGWVVIHGGVITAVGISEDRIAEGVRKIKTTSYIYTGFIDAHNHPYWNAIPKWVPAQKFENRYKWRELPAYKDAVAKAYAALGEVSYAALKYGEIRALIGGATTIQGAWPPPVGSILVRNLESECQADSILDINPADEERFKKAKVDLSAGRLRRLFVHLA